MWLTKNEKKVLKLLLDNAKLSDTSIAKKLNISSQAIGRIRKKLEEEIIKGYTLDLDYSKININIFVSCIARLTPAGKEFGEQKIEEMMIKCPNIIGISKYAGEEFSYSFLIGFRDIDELEIFFDSNGKNKELFNYLICNKMSPVGTKNILKKNKNLLCHKAIDELGTKSTKIKFGS